MDQALATWVPSTVLVGVISLAGIALWKAGSVIVSQFLLRADRLEASIAAVGIELKGLAERQSRMVSVEDHRVSMNKIHDTINEMDRDLVRLKAREHS